MTLETLPPSSRSNGGARSNRGTTDVHAEGTRTVIVVRGEAGPSTALLLSEELSRVVALHDGDVVVDLATADFIDIASARVLALGHELLHGRGRKLSFRSPSKVVTLVLALVGLTDLIQPGRPY